jgi:Uma2 family endonuclease
MAPQTSTRMTYQDYVDLPDDGKHYELIEGELILNPAPVPRHQMIGGNIYHAIRTYLDQHPGAKVFYSPIDIMLSDDNVLEPDVVVIGAARLAIIGRTNVQGPPNLVVEILSDRTRRRDETVKRKLYERHGVDEYWIVDPAIDAIKIYRRSGAAFERVAEISVETGGTITSPLLPGFALDVNVVFAN